MITLAREEYSTPGPSQGQLVAELPYSHILFRERFVADKASALEIWLCPARSRRIPVRGAEFGMPHTKRTMYISSRVEIRNRRVFSPCDQLEKIAAFFGWLEGL
jgi:hypothetical protein